MRDKWLQERAGPVQPLGGVPTQAAGNAFASKVYHPPPLSEMPGGGPFPLNQVAEFTLRK